uniref:Uncharacterized protein n=1 Tax=Rheinheimera sp. BAL341 TaxID=1708203 RepID=A0A486XJD9_9GAMM
MKPQAGVVLIMVLVFLLVISLLISAMLIVSQLSHKTAYAGQQQLQLAQAALAEHNSNIAAASDTAAEPMAVCPASYAAWSEASLQCQLLELQTQTFSDDRHFYAGYHSLVLKQTLAMEPD